MALKDGLFIKETTTTTGTGTLSLGGAFTGFNTFLSKVGSGNDCIFVLRPANSADYEVSVGTVTSGTPPTLTRTTVLESTNANNLLVLPAGTHTVGIVPLAGYATGDVKYNYNAIIKAVLKDYRELVGAATAIANVITLSPANGSVQTYTLQANTTINPDTSAETTGNGAFGISLFISTGVTPYAVTWSASIPFVNILPTIVANKTYEFSVRYINATVGLMGAYVGSK